MRRRSDGGFTLLEILIALALSVVGLIGLMGMQVVAVHARMRARSLSEAMALAQDRLELLITRPYANVALAAAIETTLGANGVSTVGGPYTRTTTVTPVGTALGVRVVVSFIGENGNAHSIIVNTVRTP